MRLRLSTLLIPPALLVLWAHPLLAREGFFLGGGLANENATGDFKGNAALASVDGTEVIVPGKPGAGNGLELMLGYGFNRYIGIEFDLADTGNIASAHVPGFPSKSSSDVSTNMIGARLTLPVSHAWDLFARLGLAQATMEFDSYAQDNFGTFGTVSHGVAFYGYGYAAGVGAEYFIHRWGIGAGYTLYQIAFTQSSADGISALPRTLKENLGQADLTVAYHFW